METTTGSVYKRQLTNGTMAPGGGDDQSSLRLAAVNYGGLIKKPSQCLLYLVDT